MEKRLRRWQACVYQAEMEMGREKDNESSAICCFLCSASGFASIFVFCQRVFLFHNTGICSEQHPRSKSLFRDPTVTILAFFGLRSDGRAGLVPGLEKTGRRNSCPLSCVQQNQSLWQALKKILAAAVAVALWRHPTSAVVSGMSIIRSIWLACQSGPAFPDAWRGTGKAPSR